MKTTAFKIFYWAFEFVFWGSALSIISIVIFSFSNMAEENTYSGYVLKEAADSANKEYFQPIEIESNTDQIIDPVLQPESWEIRFRVSGLARVIMMGYGFVYMIYLFIILFIFRKFVHSLQQGSPFIFKNYKRLKTIGFMLLLITPVNWISRLIFEKWLFNNIKSPTALENLANRFNIQLLGDTYFLNWIMVGLLVLAIAEVFKFGLMMQEEQDLTI